MNVTSDQILLKDVPGPGRANRVNALLEAMRIGKEYRPCQFVNMPVQEQTLWKYFNQLEDDGKLKRKYRDGHLFFVRLK